MVRNACEGDDPAPDGAVARLRAFARRSLGTAADGSKQGSTETQRSDNDAGTSLIPTVRYRDVAAAVRWLCTAFGMQEHRVVADQNGAARYAELTFGNGMLMVAPIEDTAFGRLMVQPDEIGGVETQVCYLFVEDARAHYARAKAAGADIVLDIEDEANGGRGYSCRDPEGHLWNFGTYYPWANQRAGSENRRPRREQQRLAALLLVALAAALMFGAAPQPQAARAGVDQKQPALEQRQGEAGDLSAKDLRERQAKVHAAALQAAQQIAAEARAQLAEARGAREKAERAAAAVRAQLEEARSAKQAAERVTAQAREAVKAAEMDAKDARAQAALEQRRRFASDRAAARARRRVASFRYFRPRLDPRCIGHIDSSCVSTMSHRGPPAGYPRAPGLGV